MLVQAGGDTPAMYLHQYHGAPGAVEQSPRDVASMRALFASLLAASAVGYGAPLVAAGTSRVAVLKLTTGERYATIAVVNGRIVVYGPASAEYPSAPSTCSSAVVTRRARAEQDA